MKIALSAESTIDLPKEIIDANDIHLIPYTLILGEDTYDDGQLTTEELFAFTDRTGKLPRTSAVNPDRLKEYFEGLLKDHDAVIHFSLSSKITSTTANAKEAAKSCSKPVYVIDTLSLSTGIALLALYGRELIDAGKDPEEIVRLVEERIPHDQTSFVIETLEYLKKGGRCSSLTAFAANALGIKPEIIMENGAMHSGKKHRGPMKKVVKEYIENTLAEYPNIDPRRCFITYSTAPEDVIEMAVGMAKAAGFQEVIPTQAHGTIACHCGPHTLGILYMADGPHPIQ